MIVLVIIQILVVLSFVYGALYIFKPELTNKAETAVLLSFGCRRMAIKAFCNFMDKKYPHLKLRAIRSADPYDDLYIIEWKQGFVEYCEIPKVMDDFSIKFTTLTAKKDTFIMCSTYKEHTIDTYSFALDKNLIVLPSIIYRSKDWDTVK